MRMIITRYKDGDSMRCTHESGQLSKTYISTLIGNNNVYLEDAIGIVTNEGNTYCDWIILGR